MRFWLYLGLIGRIALITLMAYSMYLLIFENVVAPPTLPITDPNR